jgi:Ca2+-transporting ATPase
MGKHSTDVAKEASDLVLLNDDFSTIVLAVEEGRSIYANMKAFIRYMVSSNLGEVISILISVFLGLPSSFSSLQLLWINFVTDGLPAMALSFNKPEPGILKKKPRKQDEKILSKWIVIRYTIIGIYVGIATV